MVQILEEVPSFKTMLARGLGKGIGTGISTGTETALKLLGEKRKQIQKNLSDVPGFINKRLKNLGYSTYSTPEHLEALNKGVRSLIERGYDPNEAFEHVFSEYRKSSPENIPSEESGNLLSGAGGLTLPLLQELQKRFPQSKEPFSREKFLERAKSPFMPIKEAVSEAPGRSAASALLGVGSWLEDIPAALGKRIAALKGKEFKGLSEQAREKLGEGLSPEAQKGQKELEFLGSLLGGEGLNLLRGGKGSKAISPSEILGPESRPPAGPSGPGRLPGSAMPELTFQGGKGGPSPGTSPPVQVGTKFKTSKGSTYTVQQGGKTVRDKAERPEHPGEKGIQRKSEDTFYVNKDDLRKLDLIQTTSPHEMRMAQLPDGRYGIQYVSGPNKGKFIDGTIVEASKVPQEGMHPVELWNKGKDVHFGNEIVSALLTHHIDRV